MSDCDYTELLTAQEIERIVNGYLRTKGAKPEKVTDILNMAGFYARCKLEMDAVMSGDLEIIGLGENGLEFRSTAKAKSHLH